MASKIGLVRAGLLRPTLPIPLFAQETVTNLTRLGFDFVADSAVVRADFAAVAPAPTLDATVDSEFSTQPFVCCTIHQNLLDSSL